MAEQIPIQDAMTAARAAGYGWDDINAHIDQGAIAAQKAGYTPADIHAYFGYGNQDGLVSRLTQNPEMLPAKATDPYSQPKPQTNGPLHPDLAQTYATGMSDGSVSSPAGFARTALDTLHPGIDPITRAASGQDLSTKLPSFQQTTDAALGILHANGEELNPENARDARENLFNLWAKTGQQPLRTYQGMDPVIHDAVSTPGSFTEVPGIDEKNWKAGATAAGDAITDWFDNAWKDFIAKMPSGPTIDPLKHFREAALDPAGINLAVTVGLSTGPAPLPEDLSKIFRTLEGNASGAADNAVSPAGALGRHQIMPATGAEYGFGDAEKLQYDVGYNTQAFNAIMADLTKRYDGNLRAVAVAYNAGPGVADRWIRSGYNIKALPAETQAYLAHGEREGFFGPDASPEAQQKTLDNLGTARVQRPVQLDPPDVVGDIKPTVTALEDDMNRLRTNATADKIELQQLVSGLPKEWLDQGFQERVTNEVEERLKDPAAPFSAQTQSFLNYVRPITDSQGQYLESIRSHSPESADVLGPMTAEEGYVHRVVQGQENGQRVAPAEGQAGLDKDVITGRSLTTKASGAMARQFYVFEKGGETPIRNWGGRMEESTNFAMGDTLHDPTGDWHVKPATMQEIEANTDLKYHKNFIANTTENVARLARVSRNLDFLDKAKSELSSKGLFVDFQYGSIEKPPEGMKRVEIPHLNGWAEPTIANALNDFFKRDPTDLEGLLTRVNRFLQASLFISPVTHIGNVAAHAAVGSGWDILNPFGYGKMMAAGVRAVRSVWNMDADYVQHLRDGSGLQYGSVATANFYQTLQTKLFHEQAADPKTWGSYAKAIGMTLPDLIKAEYKWSQRTLWAVNDMILLQRQFMLESKGVSRADAILQSEKDIPNYRIPTNVMGSHALSELLQSPFVLTFGRYKYGQIRAIAGIVKDLVGTQATGAERVEALGKATVLASIGLVGYPLANMGLQALTGNPNASVKNFGPFSILHGLYGLADPQTRWASAMGSIVTAAPWIDAATKFRSNMDFYGRPLVYGQSSLGTKALQGIEAGASSFYPGQLFMQAARGNVEGAVGSLAGLHLPAPTAPGMQSKWNRRDAAAARYHEMHDPIEGWFERNTP